MKILPKWAEPLWSMVSEHWLEALSRLRNCRLELQGEVLDRLPIEKAFESKVNEMANSSFDII